ncbi:MAG: ABC transporter substrate-binding protein [Pseudomonadota bacterium]
MKFLSCLVAAAALLLPIASQAQALRADGELKVLRYPFVAAETGFDPAKINDLYSRIVTAHLFEAPYRYDYLARPYKVVPHTAAAMPEVSDDFKTWTIRLKPGIYFHDDPAFKGRRRELVAEDYVYTWKRFFDPANNSPVYSGFNEEGVIGVDELRQQALKSKQPFNYDRDIEGVRALDRYTLQFKLRQPRPRFLYTITDSSLFGAVAREVIEHYGNDRSSEHPVGTGAFRLASWRRSSQIVLERHPHYRESYYDAQPAPDDAEGQALLQRFKGRRIPMIDRVEISIVEEGQPRWLAFLNREFDLVSVPLEFANVAVPNGKLAPNLAKRGIQLARMLNPDRTLLYFNMEDPIVGGYTPEKVALRRAIGLAYDTMREVQQIRRGQAIPAQSMIAPNTYGYDPDFKSENSDYDPARAKALLDLYGYVDRNGDGWRDMPDGSPLVVRYASQSSQIDRQFDEVWQKSVEAIGVRISIETAQWPENLKKARAGQLMVWSLGFSAAAPDVQDGFQIFYGPAAGGQNLARFKMPSFDALYQRMQSLPDGPERLRLIQEANKLVLAYAPAKYNVHRVITDLAQPWLVGFRRPPFGNQFWQHVDIDNSKRPK